MNIKKLIYKLSQTDPFVDQVQPPVEQPVQLTPQVQPQNHPPQQQQQQQLPETVEQAPYPTELKYWQKGDRYYFQIQEVDPKSDVGMMFKSLGYKYKFKNYSKEVSSENSQSIKDDLMNVSTQTSAVFDETGIDQMDRAFSEDAGSVGDSSLEAVLDDPSRSDDDKKKIADQFIRDKLDELAQMTDEAAKQEIIQEFLTLDKKFHSYSFINRILMWLQNPEVSTMVAGKNAWQNPNGDFKRKLKEDAEPMDIFAPKSNMIYVGMAAILSNALKGYKQANPYASEISDTDTMNDILNKTGLSRHKGANFINAYLYYVIFSRGNDNIDSITSYIEKDIANSKAKRLKAIFFGTAKGRNGQTLWKTVEVYDIEQTKPVGPDSFEKPDPKWQSEQNVPDEQVSVYVNAAMEFASKVKFRSGDEWKTGVSIDLEKEMGQTGGWSKGSEIAINSMSFGWRQFSTLVHELAHTILHFGPDRRGSTTQQVEIEAESTAYIVLKYFGLEEASFAANYLALKKATSQDVLDRYNKIDIAAKQIVNGIEKSMGAKVAHSNWFNRLKIAEIFKRLSSTK